MKDTRPSLSLMMLLCIGGLTILTISWLQPMPILERVFTTSVGLIGPGWAFSRIPSLISSRNNGRKHLQEVDAKKNS